MSPDVPLRVRGRHSCRREGTITFNHSIFQFFREPTSGIEPETSPFVYTSPYGRTRLYLSPFEWRPLSVVRALFITAPRSYPSKILWTLTVIRDSHVRCRACGQGLTTYQWRALPTELHRRNYHLATHRQDSQHRIDYLTDIFNHFASHNTSLD